MVYIEEAHVSDIGTVFRVTVYDTDSAGATSALDISAATTKQFIFGKPDGTTSTKTATFTTDGSNGQLEYSTVSGDLDTAGTWSLQVYFATSGGSWRTDVGTFKVYENL